MTGRPPNAGGWTCLRLLLIGLVLINSGAQVGWAKHITAQAVTFQQAQVAASAAAANKSGIFKAQGVGLQATNPLLAVSAAVSNQTLGLQRFDETGLYNAASIGRFITAVAYLQLGDEPEVSLEQPLRGKTAQYLLNVMLVNSEDDTGQLLNLQLTHQSLSAYAANSLHVAAIKKEGDSSNVLVKFTNGHGNYDWNGRVRLTQDIGDYA